MLTHMKNINGIGVEGISCITPMAPALDTTLGLKLDSAFATAFRSFSSIPSMPLLQKMLPVLHAFTYSKERILYDSN